MNRQIDLELIFPVSDAASARFMALKADCLHRAGIITDLQRQEIQLRLLATERTAPAVHAIGGRA